MEQTDNYPKLKPARSLDELWLPEEDLDKRRFFTRCVESAEFQRCAWEREQVHLLALWSRESAPCHVTLQDLADMFGTTRSTILWHLSKPFDRAEGSQAGRPGRPRKVPQEAFDAMISFVLRSFENRCPCTYEDVREYLEDEFEVTINLNTLRSWVHRSDALKTVTGVPMEDERIFSSEEAIDDFFARIEGILNVVDVPSAFLMNIDEAGFDQYVDARKSTRLVPSSYERSQIPAPVTRAEKRATLLAGICADGHCLKPLLILQRDTMEAELLQLGYTVDKVHYARSDTGFMNTRIFLDWAEHTFLPEVRARRALFQYSGPAILLLDGFGVHHCETFETLCEDENIVVVYYPAHTSDQLQACDLGLFSNQKRWMSNISVDKDLNRQTKQAIRVLDSLRMASSPKNIIGAFRRGGIVNRYDHERQTLVACVDRRCASAVRHYQVGEEEMPEGFSKRRVRI